MLFDSQWFGSADHLDEVVDAGEDAVPVVLRHIAEVLHKMRGPTRGGQSCSECRDFDRLVVDWNAQGVFDFRGDSVPIEFFGAEQRIDLAVMRIGVLQDRRNDFGLIRGCDGGVANIGKGQPVDALDRKSTRLNSSHLKLSRMPSSA